MFKFRDKKQLIGVLLGATCFVPSFIVSFLVGAVTDLGVGIWVMLMTQILWLTSINLVTWSLERENILLKEKLKQDK